MALDQNGNVQYAFVPSAQLQSETGIQGNQGFDMGNANVLRKDLSVSKVGEITQCDPGLTDQLLTAIV